ncbi:serine/threonine protein kinase [Clonorchis sinensis]|uniref:non-specific serine/threonine protein kinase n=1 Tax=Clonorchis sinensis TaxID=79923 RepID=H2KPU7_CLOSI|nr:serine/threonine protein kinase [Clonorchis sinensis]
MSVRVVELIRSWMIIPKIQDQLTDVAMDVCLHWFDCIFLSLIQTIGQNPAPEPLNRATKNPKSHVLDQKIGPLSGPAPRRARIGRTTELKCKPWCSVIRMPPVAVPEGIRISIMFRLNYSKKPIRVISLIYPNDTNSEKLLSRSEGERFCTTENAESVSNVRKLSNPVITYTSVLHRDLSNGIHRPEMSNTVRDDQRKTNQQPATTTTILVAERHEPVGPVTSVSNSSEKTVNASVKPRLLSPPVIVSRSPSSADSTERSQDFVTNVNLKMNVSDAWTDANKKDRWTKGIRRNPTYSPIPGGADQSPEKRVISPIKQNGSQLWGMPRFADNRTNTRTRMARSPPVTLKRTVLNGERSPDVRIVRKDTRICTSTPTSPVFRTVEQPSRVFSIETPGQQNHAPRDGWSSLSHHDGPNGKHYGTQYTTRRIRPQRTPSAYESTTRQPLSIVYPRDIENGYSERCTPMPSGEVRTRTPYCRDASPELISRRDSGYKQGLEMKRPQSNLSKYSPVDKSSYSPSVTSNMRIPIIPKYDQAGGNLRPTKINRESSTTPSGEGRTSSGSVKRPTSSNGEKITVPRKINWAFGINIQGDNSQALLRSLLRILEQKRIDYVYQNPYRLQCVYQPYSEMDQTPPANSQSGLPIKWELEIVQLIRSKNYGVRFRYLSGDQSQYRILEKSICGQFQRNSD